MNALERFRALEGRIGLALKTLKELRTEKDTLEMELAAARREIQNLQADLKSFEKQHEAVKGRVETLIASISVTR
jgi:chromosome segregation ATPase